MAPILPGLTDSAAAIDAVTSAAAAHGAAFFGAGALRLAPYVKEHYLGFIEATFPDLLPRYERAYTGVNAPRDYLAALQRRIDQMRARYGFADRRQDPPDAPSGSYNVVAPRPPRAVQLALPL